MTSFHTSIYRSEFITIDDGHILHEFILKLKVTSSLTYFLKIEFNKKNILSLYLKYFTSNTRLPVLLINSDDDDE